MGCKSNSDCQWDWVPKAAKQIDYFNKDWEVACIPKDCQGINHDICDAHSGMCQWDWVKDWKVSCIRKDCQGFNRENCELHSKKCKYNVQVSDWKKRCVAK